MNNDNGERAEMYTTPPRIDLVVAADTADMAGANLLDNYELEDDVDNAQYSLSDKMVHYIGGQVHAVHWAACKAVLVFQAGIVVCKLHTMTKSCIQAAHLECYTELVSRLDPLYFSKESQAYFMMSMRSKDAAITGDSLHRNFGEYRKKMRSLIIPLLPATFNLMKSGKGFHETCNDMIVAAFRREIHKGTAAKPGMPWAEAEQMLPPCNWEYKKLPWVFVLCVKIFRKNVQLAPNVNQVLTDVQNVLESRASVKRKQRQVTFEENGKKAAKMPEAAIGVEVGDGKVGTDGGRRVDLVADNRAINQKHQVWAKVHMAKAMEESANVAKRLAEFEAIEKCLSVLERTRMVIGEIEFTAGVKGLVASMPKTGRLAQQCEVICIGDDDVIDLCDSDNEDDKKATMIRRKKKTEVVIKLEPPDQVFIKLEPPDDAGLERRNEEEADFFLLTDAGSLDL
jgi:hypothetical protein